jgi:ornithine cyclodeaminase/alanine dehydrogenase-like protein (mu-crystallin family)
MFDIVCIASGDRAQADDLDSALVAAATLVNDHSQARRRQGATLAARRSIVILRDGLRDNVATTLAHQGAGRSPASSWSRS